MDSFYELFGYLCYWYFMLYLLYKLLKGLWTCWIGSALGFNYNFKGDENSWAIITGSTDGIGLEYARQLADKSYNLLLISRSIVKLEDAKASILSRTRGKERKVEILVADFSKLDIYDSIEEKVMELVQSGAKMEVLVNNVGCSYPCADYFTMVEGSWKTLENMINVNMVSCTKLMHLVLPLMANVKKGVVINVSSLSGSYPMPLLAAYSGSKAYVDFMSRALQMEYKDKGIIVQSVLPAYVATNMSKIRKTSFLVASPKDYVKNALQTVGLEDRTYGYWTHKMQGFFHDVIIPRLIWADYNSKIAFDSLKGVRKRYYKKYNIKDKDE